MRDNKRYARQMALPGFGPEGQKRLKDARVLIVGLGGLGAPAAMYLAGAGVGHLGLCDTDAVSISNLHRQILYTEAEVDILKTAAAARRLQNMNSEVDYGIILDSFDDEFALDMAEGYDLVVDCCDNFRTRLLIDKVCSRLDIPWVHGAIGPDCGRAALFGGKAGTRFSDLYPEAGLLPPSPPSPQPVLGPVAGIIGSLEAATAIQYLTGMPCPLDGRIFTIDISTLETNIINI